MKQRLHIPPGHAGSVMHFSALPALREHRHDELELNLLLSGSVTYRVGPQLYRLAPHSMAWLFRGQNHLIVQHGAELDFWVVVFKPSLVTKSFGQDRDSPMLSANPPGHFVRMIHPTIIGGLENVLQSARHAETQGNPALLNAALGYLLHKSWAEFDAGEPTVANDVLPPSVTRALDALDLGENDETPDLARVCGLEAAHLNRLFRRTMGVTLTDYRNRRRLERFWHLSRRFPERTLLACALDAGFGSYAQFHRVHRKLCGRAPGQTT